MSLLAEKLFFSSKRDFSLEQFLLFHTMLTDHSIFRGARSVRKIIHLCRSSIALRTGSIRQYPSVSIPRPGASSLKLSPAGKRLTMLDRMTPEAIRRPQESKGDRPSTVFSEAEMEKASGMSVRRSNGIDFHHRDFNIQATHCLEACHLPIEQHRTHPPRLTSFANKALTRS